MDNNEMNSKMDYVNNQMHYREPYVKSISKTLEKIDMRKLQKNIIINNDEDFKIIYMYLCSSLGKRLDKNIKDEHTYMNIVQEINCVLADCLSKVRYQ